MIKLLAALLLAQAPLAHAQDKPSKEQLRKLADIYGAVQHDYATEVDDVKLFAGCFDGMMRSLDSRSELLDPRAVAEYRGEVAGLDASIGVTLEKRAGLSYVSGILDDTPAAKSSLRIRDYILAVNGQTTEELDLSTVVRLLRGEPGSTVKLTVRQYGDIAEREIVLTRAKIPAPVIKPVFIGPGIGYIRINHFDAETPRALADAFQLLKTRVSHVMKGLVLDLRDSPGGLLQSSAEVAGMFLQGDLPIYSSKGRLAEMNHSVVANRDYFRKLSEHYSEPWPPELAALPLVVLVNESTASGAEIVAAALQYNKRAHIVGRKTQGVGSVQLIRPYPDGSAIKLTAAYYTSPSGVQLQGKGVTPDQTMPDRGARSSDMSADPWVGAALAWLRTKR